MANFVEFEYTDLMHKKTTKYSLNLDTVSSVHLDYWSKDVSVNSEDEYWVKVDESNRSLSCSGYAFRFKTKSEAKQLYDKLRGKNTDCKHKSTDMGGKYRIQCRHCKKILISEGQWIDESLVKSVLERFKEEASEDNIETKDPSNGAFTKIKYALDNLEGAVQHLLIEEALASLQESKEFPGAERLAKECYRDAASKANIKLYKITEYIDHCYKRIHSDIKAPKDIYITAILQIKDILENKE